MKTKNYIALIPLRGGSKSIPLKNIQIIAGKPLFYWSTKAALDSNIYSKIFISTDSIEIKKTVSDYFSSSINKEIEIIDRPAEISQDDSSSEEVLLHTLDYCNIKNYPCDIISLVQATSPLTTAIDFINAKNQFEMEVADSLVTGTIDKRFYWDKNTKSPINYDYNQRPRRQNFKGLFQENGAFYFTKIDLLKNKKSRLGGQISLFLMNEENSIELDEPIDWKYLSQILISKNKSSILNNNNNNKIKALILDVDGTLTDAGMYYDENGEALKKFNTRDAHGIKLLEKIGIMTCIITAESSPRVHSRMHKLEIKHYFHGIKNKLEILEHWRKEQNLKWEELAYGGDDINDLICMQKVGLSFCPSDAVSKIKNSVHYICENTAGLGAVREFIDLFLLKDN